MNVKLYSLIIGLLVLLCACEQEQDSGHADHDHHHHGHVHSAPHGGTLIEIGDHQANLEICCDRESGTLTVYVLGPHAEQPLRIAEEQIAATLHYGETITALQLQAQSSSLSGERVGDSATFAATDAALKQTGEMRLHIAELNLFDQVFNDISGTVP